MRAPNWKRCCWIDPGWRSTLSWSFMVHLKMCYNALSFTIAPSRPYITILFEISRQSMGDLVR